jgi:N-acetylglucosaminyl-diphospho-decaprenol L-rhamnosyltransferase
MQEPEFRARWNEDQNPKGIGLISLLLEDLRTHEGVTAQGFWALATNRLGNWRMGIRWKLLRLPFSLLYKALAVWVHWTTRIELPYIAPCGRRVRIWHHGGCVLGARHIGDDVQIRHNVTLGLANHNDPIHAIPTIEERVILGAGCVVVGAITIGHDSVVAANAVVTKDVPPHSLVGGIPAKILKRLDEPTPPAPLPDLEPTDERVLAVIVNYRTAELAKRCLASLAREKTIVPQLEVRVVENASGDDSAAILRAELDRLGMSTWATVIESEENLGFAGGNNLALREALKQETPHDAYLLVNPDVELYGGALHEMLQLQAREPQAALIGPATELQRGKLSPNSFRYPCILNAFSGGIQLGLIHKLLSRWDPRVPPQAKDHEADWISGGCMLIRSEVLVEIGIFDEEFFLYFEEVDLCLRARAAGHRCWYAHEAKIFHDAGAATGMRHDSKRSDRTPAWWFQSRRHYLKKHHGSPYLFFCDVAFLVGRCTKRLIQLITLRRTEDPKHFLLDFARHAFLPAQAR